MSNLTLPTAARWQPACRATRLVFLIIGIATASWAAMVPYAKARLHLDDAVLGSILLALGMGAMLAMPLAGVVLRRLGSGQVIRFAGVLLVLSVPSLVLASSALTLGVALFMFGGLVGVIDVAMNHQAVEVEAEAGRPLMSSFHGLFSLGGLVGGVALAGLLSAGLPLLVCAVGVGVVAAIIVLTQYRYLMPHQPHPAQKAASSQRRLGLPHGMVLILGMLCFCAFLTEGAILDWGAVFLHFERGVDAARAGFGYAAFSVAMTTGRLTGDRVTHALGPVRVVLFGGLVAASGMVMIVVAPWTLLSLVGFVLVGLGASNVVPVLFSAASRIPGVAASTALPTVTMLGYTGMLAGPALIGYLARATSLPLAFGGVAVLMLIVAVNAGRVRQRAVESGAVQVLASPFLKGD
ncbi:MFS transporter [Andreprevotia chitinilytica]|uniref:MFS transporter n=1 Tax=Andreprevotia chitinilytica TaxID=396808 RepID=UPI001B8098F8|nr:MFS transporter [Andreprevotia chitinilytica]